MHGGTDSGSGRDELRFQCGQIAGVHQIGPDLAQQFPEPHDPAETVSRCPMQRMKLDRLGRDAMAEIAEVGEGDHRVPIMLRRQGVEQVDHAVFHPARIETMNDMHDMGRHGPST